MMWMLWIPVLAALVAGVFWWVWTLEPKQDHALARWLAIQRVLR